MPEFCERIAEDLERLGVSPGETILVHSSFKSLGPVPGGIGEVIRGLRGAVGERGTLLMPALSWTLRPPDIFDPRRTPVNVGAVPEFFRTMEGVLRSIHPTHSVCATGRRALELLADHEKDHTPCGRHSPFRKLVETEGSILMIGCGVRPNTTMHALEEYLEPPYLYGEDCLFTIRDPQGRVYRKEYRTHGFIAHGYSHRYDRIMDLDIHSCMRTGPILGASAVRLDGPGLKRLVLEKLREDPFFFVDPDPADPGSEDPGAEEEPERRRDP